MVGRDSACWQQADVGPGEVSVSRVQLRPRTRCSHPVGELRIIPGGPITSLAASQITPPFLSGLFTFPSVNS